MLLTIKISGKELREVEEFVQRGDVDSVHDFVRYAIQNQLQLEKERVDTKGTDAYDLLKTSTEIIPDEKSTSTLHLGRIEPKNKIDLPPVEINKFISLDASKLKERTKKPIWVLKNKYFPLKFVLRVIQNEISRTDEGRISINLLKDNIRGLTFSMRSQMEFLDKKMENKRGEKFATGFSADDANSFERFFKNFVIYVSPDENTIKGMPYELGFIDVMDGEILLTEDGNNFASLFSPILDSYIPEKEMPKHQFSDEELNFLYEHIRQKVFSEAILYRFMLSQIEKGINAPEELNNTFRSFLDDKFPKEEGYSAKTASSIRAGVTSRMVELKLIKIEKIGGKSFYKINEGSKSFMEE